MPISLIPYANSQSGRSSPADNSPFTFASSSESPQPARQSLGGFAPPAPEGDQKQLPVFAPIETRGGLRSPGRFGQPSEGTDPVAVRREKRALVQTPDKPARNTLGLLAGAHSHSADADETLQAQLIAQMGSVPDALVTVPVRSLMSQPFDIYKRVLNQPEVLAWLRGKGFSLGSVTIGKNAVSGLVTHNGVTSHQAYTLQDTSGWWQVSARVMHALEALDPTHQGVPYVSINSQQISRNVASLFYGVSPPHTGVFQGTCRVNRPTMPLFSRPAAPDPGSASPCRSVPSYASDLTSAPGFSPWLVCTAHGAAPGSDGPVLDAAQPV